MKKRFCSALLAAVLTVPGFVPVSTLNVMAEEVMLAETDSTNLVYEHADAVTVSNGSGALRLGAEDVAKFAPLTDVTIELTAAPGGSGLYTLFFAGDTTQASHYVSFYITGGNTVGYEFVNKKNASSNPEYKVNKTLTGIDLTQEHLYALTYSANDKVSFYIDGELVYEVATTKNFIKDVVSDLDYVGFGKGIRGSNTNAYPYTGTIKDIRIYSNARSQEEIRSDQLGTLATPVFASGSVFKTQDKTGVITDTESINSIKSLTEGTWTARFRMDGTNNNGVKYLSALSNAAVQRDFVSLYISNLNNTPWVVGIDAPDKNIGGSVAIPTTIDVTDGHWHDVTAVRDGSTWTFYVDGQSAGTATSSATGLFDKVTTPTAITTGFARKSNGTHNPNPLHGSIAFSAVYAGKASAIEVKASSMSLNHSGVEAIDLSNVYKTEDKAVFYSTYDGSLAYRIPALFTTMEGTVIAGIDKRNDGSGDSGNIDVSIRRKERGKDWFDDPIIVSDLLKGSGGSTKAAVMIDPVMVQETNDNSKHKGRIHLFADMFPQSNAAMELGNQNSGNEYLTIDGNKYLSLYKDGETQPYVIKEENGIGVVYKTISSGDTYSLGEKTDYTVTLHCSMPFQTRGNLYKAGVPKGNIYMNENCNEKGELHMRKTMSIWHFYSDDDGKTWSEPTDLAPIIKQDWMRFCGTGPGRGVQLENGRLVMPIYTTNKSTTNFNNHASMIVVSDDGGENWELKGSPSDYLNLPYKTATSVRRFTECQPLQLRNGDLLMFMRNDESKVIYGVSKDNGETWSDVVKTNVPAVYCQYTAINYVDKNNQEYVIVATPSGPGRTHGTITRGAVQADGSIEWDLAHAKLVQSGGYAYSCLTQIDDAPDGTKRFGLLYEWDKTPIDQMYFEFDEKFMTAENIALEETAPVMESVRAAAEDGKLTVDLTFNQKLFAAGSPTLTVQAGEKTLDLAMKSGGDGTVSAVFEAEMPSDFNGVIVMKSLNLANSELSNLHGKSAAVKESELLDSTEIRPVAIHDRSSQHSDNRGENTDGAAENIIDGNPRTFWHSIYGTADEKLPQYVTFDMGKEVTLSQMNFLNRQSNSVSLCKEYRLEGSLDGENFMPILDSELAQTSSWQHVPFAPTTVRYVRFTEDSNYGDKGYATIAEISFNVEAEGVDRSADKTELMIAHGMAETVTDIGFSAASWQNFQTVLQEVNEILADPYASQPEILQATQRLRDVKRSLANTNELKSEIAEYKTLNAEDYEQESWNAFKTELDAVDSSVESFTNQHQVDNKAMKLKYLCSQLQEVEPADSYTVTFNTNGANTIASQTVDANGKVTKPADPKKENFQFGGWFTDEACTQTYDFDAPVTRNTTLYAKWLQIFGVLFKYGANNGETYNVPHIEGHKVSKPSDPTWEGHRFDGWFADEACKTPFDFDQPVSQIGTVIYAKWVDLSVEPVGLDFTLINAALSKANELDTAALAKYSATGKDAFATALANANKAKTDAESQTALDDAAKALNQALLALRRLPSSADLDVLN